MTRVVTLVRRSHTARLTLTPIRRAATWIRPSRCPLVTWTSTVHRRSTGRECRVCRVCSLRPKSKLPLIIGGIAGVLVLILIGVGAYFFLSGDEEEDPDSDSTSTSATADPTTSAPNPKPTTSATSSVPTAAPNPGGYHANGQYSVDYSSGLHIEITKIEKGPADKEGSDTLVVTYSMTNNSSEEQSALLNTPSLKQKGIDMNPAYYAKGKEPAGYDNFAIVRVPVGQTKTFQRAYKMPYPNDPVTFKTLDWDDFNANIPDWTWQP